jgi:predicted RNA-binding protein with RPS1 domain
MVKIFIKEDYLMPVTQKKQEEGKIRASRKQVEKAREVLIFKERNGFAKGEKKVIFKELARRFEISEFTVKNTYYNHVRPLVDKEREQSQQKPKLTVISTNKDDKDKEEQMELSELDEDTQNEVINSKEVMETPTIEDETKDSTKKESTEKTEKTVSTTKKVEIIERDREGRPLKPPYKYGDILDVRVTNITDFGAFLYTLDEYEYKGLLHISEMRNRFVENIEDYLAVDDVIQAKVILAQPNRIQFSTKEMNLQPKYKPKGEIMNTVLGEKLNSIKDQLQLSEPVEKTDSKQELQELIEDGGELKQEEIEQLMGEVEIEYEKEVGENELQEKLQDLEGTSNKEFKEIQTFLNSKIGALSPNAQLSLLKILENNTVFKSTMAISKVAESFEVDYGLLFLNEVRKQLEKDERL